MKKLISFCLAAAICVSLLIPTAMAAGINDSNVFVKQNTNVTCTLASATMLIRRQAILNGSNEWSSITESALKTTAWSGGLKYSFSYAGISCKTYGMKSDLKLTSVDQKKSYFISTLAAHPEGIVIYSHNSSQTHAVLLTDYDSSSNTFFCADPANSIASGRIKLVNCLIHGSTQDEVIGNINQIWIVVGGRIETTAPVCTHTYNGKGICTSCGAAYPYNVISSSFSAKTIKDANLQTEPYGDRSYFVQTIAAGTTLSVVATTINHYGNTWYKLSNGNWVCSDCCDKVTQKPSLSISGQNAPSALSVGDNFGIRGTISTNCGTITKVYGAILNSSGSAIQSGSYSPNSATHDLRYSINNDLVFNKLSAGTYTYKVTATATNGNQATTATLINSSFTVGNPPASTQNDTAQKPSLSISGQNAPSTLNVGDNFGIRGTISTNCGTITKVYGAILNSSGSAIQSGSYSPNSATHDLRYSINNDLVFNNLSAGTYIYKVTATATNGNQATTATLINSSFTVGNPPTSTPTTASSLCINMTAYPSSISKGSCYGLRGSVTSNYTITSVRGYILSSSGNAVQSTTDTPNSTSMDVRYANLNNNLVFNNLSCGSYTLQVVATDSSGKTVQFNAGFSVN